MNESNQPDGALPSAPSVPAPEDDGGAERVSLLSLYWVFFQMGALGFGGGLVGWVYHEAVTKRGWLNESEFMSMATMGQVLPGINIANFSIYVGQRKRGVLGSCTCLIGLLSAPFFIIIGLAGIFAQIDSIPWVHDVLVGVAAAAVGLLASICVKSFRQSVKGVAHATLLFAIILAVGILRVPMVPVVVIAAPLSVLLAWYLGRRNPNA